MARAIWTGSISFEIDPIYYERTYHVAPRDDAATRAYALLTSAMEERRRVGIGKVVMREKQYLAAIPATVLDLMEALRASLERGGRAPATKRAVKRTATTGTRTKTSTKTSKRSAGSTRSSSRRQASRRSP